MLLLVLLGLAAATEPFNADRVHLIDYAAATNSYLFRCNEPLYSNETFDYAGLLRTMRERVANATGVPAMPEKVFLVDVNLLTLEMSAIRAEEKFFTQHADLGTFVHRPIWGSLVNPFDLPEPARKEAAKTLDHWSHDRLPTLMEQLRTMLTETYRNSAIFVHCNAGEDRTGEVSGSYYIRYLNMSFAQALAVDNHNENRDIRCMSAREFIWYCLYLHYTDPAAFPNLGSCKPVNKTFCTNK